MDTRRITLHLSSLLLLTMGCQPAAPYESAKPAPSESSPPASQGPQAADPTVAWLDAKPAIMEPDVPIEFVHESDGEAWAQLTRFWNRPTEAEKAAAALALFPGTAAPLAQMKDVVRIKVPAGLDNPRDYFPSPDPNPPTLRKWQLGRQLFYDNSWLGGGESCASCHDPHTSFADTSASHHGFNTPTLVNCVFNRRQFWDGRVQSLEEVVQRSLDDETAPADRLPFHVWGGVVNRLRMNTAYPQPFRFTFGAEPTADAVGKALATYMRTLLAADSVHDRAVRTQAAAHAAELKAEHFENALDEADLKKLGLEKDTPAEAAKKIYRGYRLFHDLDERKTGCIMCHKGREFTDGGFHNLGVGFQPPVPGQESGRFTSLPLGLKDRTLIGAYKTPTLRGLMHTAPFFHDGSAATLEDAVRFHTDGGRTNDYVDPQLRVRDVPEADFTDLVLFLRALDGEDVDPAVGPQPK
jgi:cytochrome c peroxidase